MTNATCLRELENQNNFDSAFSLKFDQLNLKVHCVLTNVYLIIFKKISDVSSFKQIPLNDRTKVEYKTNSNDFSITRGIFTFTFTSQDANLVQMWANKIGQLIQNNKSPDSVDNFYHAEVHIDQFGGRNHNVYILLRHDDHKLYIYESLDYHRYDIVTHAIDLKFYNIENPRKDSGVRRLGIKSIVLIGANASYKICFTDESSVSEWKTILNSAKNLSFAGNKTSILDEIYKSESNKFCADCSCPNPEWVSTNLCITVCINCAGLHRGLGTCYSRIQSAIIDERIWEDGQLIKLLHEIGNDKSNSFWFHKKPKYIISCEDPNFLKDKYVKKLFIDSEFESLSENELKNHLKSSVSKSDVFQTLRLWKSISFNYNQEFIEELLKIARNSNQPLQEKFISLQPNFSKIEIDSPTKLLESVLQLSYNDGSKLDNLFLVSLSTTCISIKIEKSNTFLVEMTEVCCIPYDNICLLWNDEENENLLISIDPCVEFKKFILGKKYNNELNIINTNKINFYNQTRNVLKNFQLELLKLLIPNNLIPFSEESNLFMNISLKIDSEVKPKCKSYLTEHQLIIGSPISTIYNLKTSNKRTLMDDNRSICIDFKSYQLSLETTNQENRLLIFNYIEKSAKNIDVQILLIDKMISFISYHGLHCEGIFRISGTLRKVKNLYNLIENSATDFYIDPTKYNAHDVTSCLKKYFSSLVEPIFPVNVLISFQNASQIENLDDKINQYQKAVSRLPKENYDIIRKILELFLMIQMTSKSNKMDSKSLAISSALSLISFEESNVQTSASILKDLIDNFRILFNYSNSEFNILVKFIDNPDVIPQQRIIRTFYIDPQISSNLKLKVIEHEKLNFLHQENKFSVIHVPIDQCLTVRNIIEMLFTTGIAELWHILNKTSKFSNCTKKRLVFAKENTKISVVNPRTITNYSSYFIFLPKELSINPIEKRLFRSEIQLKYDKYQDFTLFMNYPNSMQLFDNQNQSADPIYNVLLTDLNIYRSTGRKSNKVLIYCGQNTILKCRFMKVEELEEFFHFYVEFRSKININDL